MFNHKQKRIDSLQLEVQQKTSELEAIKANSIYNVFVETEAEVRSMLDNPGLSPSVIVQKAIAARQDELIHDRVQQLADEEAHKLMDAKKVEINDEIMPFVMTMAGAALKKFCADKADMYRDETRNKLVAEQSKSVIQAAREQIVTEERQKLVAEAKARLEAGESFGEHREAQKERAKKLRGETKRTRRLELQDLVEKDEITICFADSDKGYEPLTDVNDYSGAYRSWLEARKLTVRLNDPKLGEVEVLKDSWMDDPNTREHSLVPGYQIRILAKNPIKDDGDFSPLILKGKPLCMQTLEGNSFQNGGELPVWWVDLGEFRALS